MNTISTSIGITALLLGLAEPALAGHVPLGRDLRKAGYEQIANKKGVKVYKHRTSKTIRVGADGRITATPDQILAALLDYHNQVGKIDRLSESRILRRGASHLVVYQRLNLPVISDRDFVLRVKWWKKNGTTYVSYKAIKGHSAKRQSGVVRVSSHSGTWQIKPLACGLSQARFEVGIDLAGWLPLWMARSGAGKELPDLFASVNTMTRKSNRRIACLSK